MSTVGKISYMQPLENITGEEWIEVMVGSGEDADNLRIQVKDLQGMDGKDGDIGPSTYQLAVSIGFTGTLQEWLESLKGEDGSPGLPGSKGEPGVKGDPGDSAYKQAQQEGFVGTLQEWLESLKGEKGDKGDPGEPGAPAEGGAGAQYYSGVSYIYDPAQYNAVGN